MANAENDNKRPGLQERIERLRTWTSHEQINMPFWYEHVVFAILSLIILLLIVFTT
jgi:hypothetical protein